MELSGINSIDQWKEIYLKLISWELKLDENSNETMMEILKSQKNEANKLFSKFIEKNYQNWINDNESSPLLSNSIIKDKLVKELSESTPTLFVVIDNLRYDQWKAIEPLIYTHYNKIMKSLT